MRILFLNARYPPEGLGGPAHSTRYIAEQVAAEGHRATVLCRSPTPGWRREEIRGVSVLRAGPDVAMPAILGGLEQLLTATGTEVVHALHPSGLPVFAAAERLRRRGLPLVQTLVSFDLLCHRNFIRDGKPCQEQCRECVAATSLERRYLAGVDAVVGVSRYMLDTFRAAGMLAPGQLNAVIHQAYAPERSPAPRPADDEAFRFAFLGRLDPLKGLDALLAALTGPALAGRNWQLRIAGTGDPGYMDLLRRTYPDSRIRFEGFVEPGELLDSSDALVAPALWAEPFGRIVVEAYAHGVPVIASRRGGMLETVEHGRTGLLFEPDEPGALERALEKCLDDRTWWRGLVPAVRARWQSAFTPAAVARQYLRIYESVHSARLGAGSY